MDTQDQQTLEDKKIPETFYSDRSKYTKTISIEDENKVSKTILEVKDSTDVKQLTAYVIDLMYNKQFPHVKLKGISKNMSKCVMIAELIKRKIRGLHQVSQIQTLEIRETFMPTIEGPEYFPFEKLKSQTVLLITLYKQTPLNIKVAGYQRPLEIKYVSTRDPREYIRYVLEEKKVPKKKKIMAEQREEERRDADKGEKDFDDEYEIEGDKRNNSDGERKYKQNNYPPRQEYNRYNKTHERHELKDGDDYHNKNQGQPDTYQSSSAHFKSKDQHSNYNRDNIQKTRSYKDDNQYQNKPYYKKQHDDQRPEEQDYSYKNPKYEDNQSRPNINRKWEEKDTRLNPDKDRPKTDQKEKQKEEPVQYHEKIVMKKWDKNEPKEKHEETPHKQEYHYYKKPKKYDYGYKQKEEQVYVKKEDLE